MKHSLHIFILQIFIICSFLFSNFKETIYFESANPFSLKDIIKNLDNQAKQEVYGFLTIPDIAIDSNKKVPLVIGVAGSKDWGSHHIEYMEMYQSMGIATFELQSFKSRGVSSTVGSQIEVTTAMIILDSYRALQFFQNHPNIDGEKVAITGWSLGGGVALYSGWMPIKNAISKEQSFAAHLSYYPPCFVTPDNLSFTKAPIHILAAELDEWVPAQACEELVESIEKEKNNIELTVFKGAHHSYDRTTPLKISTKAYKFGDCRFRMDDYGMVRMNFLNIPMSTPFLQKIGFLCCTKRGPIYGGHPESRKLSFSISQNFMHEHLLKK